MLARVAGSLYWMARYLERAENTARLINATAQALLDPPPGARFGWDILLRVAGLDRTYAACLGEGTDGAADQDGVVNFLIGDERNPSSITSCVLHARENARAIREVLPMQAWERINDLYLFVRAKAVTTTRGQSPRDRMLDAVIERRQSIIGLLAGSMSHDIGYQFLKLGRNIERADMTTRIVDVNAAMVLPQDTALTGPALERLWMGTLNALSAYEMYRRHVSVHVRPAEVVDFLLRDPHFPRTVSFCLNEIESCLSVLPYDRPAMQAARHAWRRLEAMHLNGPTAAELHTALDQIQADLGELHLALAYQYFGIPREAAEEAATAG